MKLSQLKDIDKFTTKEITCRCCKTFKFTAESVKSLLLLNKLRVLRNKPMIVNCGYRCESNNARVGGVKGSYHKKGQAFDIRMPKAKQKVFAKQARSVGFNGIGFYNTFVHIDNRKFKATWKK